MQFPTGVRAAFGVAVLLSIASSAKADDAGARIWLEEDGYCGGSVASLTSAPPVPAKRSVLRYPPKALAARVGGVATIRLSVGNDGFVTGSELLDETPGYGFGSAARMGLTTWGFARNRPGTYCVKASFSVGDRTAEPPLPRAPKPIDTDPAPYVSDAAAAASVSCRVDMFVRIDDDGAVPAAGVLAEAPAGWNCGTAAVEAVKQWHFPAETTPGRYRMTLSVR